MKVPYISPVAEAFLLDMENPVMGFSQGGEIIIPSSVAEDYDESMY